MSCARTFHTFFGWVLFTRLCPGALSVTSPRDRTENGSLYSALRSTSRIAKGGHANPQTYLALRANGTPTVWVRPSQ